MTITYAYLADHPETIPALAAIWYDDIGKPWVPNASIEKAVVDYHSHCQRTELPLTIVALADGKPIGMASLRENDGIREGVLPWLGSVVVDPAHRSQGVGEGLINRIKQEAVQLGFKQLHLFALDPHIPEWYQRLGWDKVGMDVYHIHPVTVMTIDLME